MSYADGNGFQKDLGGKTCSFNVGIALGMVSYQDEAEMIVIFLCNLDRTIFRISIFKNRLIFNLQMGFRSNIWLILISCIICAKINMGQDAVAISENIKKFAEVYGFATQIMNLGGSFMGGSNGNGVSSQSSNNFYVENSARPNKLENSFMNKPMASFFDNKNYLTTGFGDFTNNLAGMSLSEYGGGPLGAASSRSQPRSIIESLMGTFLGSSVDNNSPSNIHSGFGNYGGVKSQTRSGSDIEAIVRSLTRSGAKRAEAEPDHLNILGQFFGKRKK